MLRRKGPHKPEFVYDIVLIHFLNIYTDLIEHNIVGDTKAPLLRCFLFISKLKAGNIITTGQYMNSQTFSNLQFRPLLENSFHSFHIDMRDTSGEKIPFVSVGFKPYISSNFKRVISEYKGFLHYEGYDYEDFPEEIMEAPLSEPFFTNRMKCLAHLMASYCMVNWELTFPPLLNCYIQM